MYDCRSLDHALATTHSSVRMTYCVVLVPCSLEFMQIRVFLVTAKYCTLAVWQDDRRRLFSDWSRRGIFGLLADYVRCWW